MSREQQRPQQYHDKQRHVIPTTSPATRTQIRSGHAVANVPVSSLKLPAIGQAMHSGCYTSLAADRSVATSSSPLPTQQPVASLLPTTTPMGIGQSKPTPPPPLSVAATSSSAESSSYVAPSPTKGINAAGNKLKRVFVPRRKKSGDLYSLGSKWNESLAGETLTPSKKSLPPTPPATTSSSAEPLSSTSSPMRTSRSSSPSPSIQV